MTQPPSEKPPPSEQEIHNNALNVTPVDHLVRDIPTFLRPDSDPKGIVAQASVLGMTVVVSVVLGLGVDHVFDCAPWGMLIGMFLGFVSAFWRLWQAMKS